MQGPTTRVSGIHHITAIAGDPQENLDFYVSVLGLRLVKRSINQDAPDTYHLFFADGAGHPGTDLTFFPWPAMARGRHGSGVWGEVAFAIPPGSIDYWEQRLREAGVKVGSRESRFSEPVLPFEDHHAMRLAMSETVTHGGQEFSPWTRSPVPEERQIRALSSVRLTVTADGATVRFLAGACGFKESGRDGDWVRYTVGEGAGAQRVDIRVDRDAPRGTWGTGSVHHVAFRVAGDDEQRAVREQIIGAGGNPTPVIDRFWFKSVYAREPSGALCEVATDGPGFAVDEDADHLGESLVLPPWFEARRASIEAGLPPLAPPVPAAAVAGAPVELAGFTYRFRAGSSATTLMLLHGTGGDEADLLDLGGFLAPGAALLSPRGRAPEGSVNRWFARFAPGVLDEDDIRRRAAELAGFALEAADRHRLDHARIWAAGYSNGANMAVAAAMLHTGLFAGLVLLRPMLPLRPDPLPDLPGLPVFIAAGLADTMVPRDSVDALAGLLSQCRADVEVRWSEAGHRFGIDEVEQAREWLARRLR